MWTVVVYEKHKTKEKVGPAESWQDAFRSYTEQAKTINSVDRQGNYLYPDTHIALRVA